MSDYLDRILQRSLGEKPAIRPRLPGMFEPVEAAAGIELHQQEVTATAPRPTRKVVEAAPVDRGLARPAAPLDEPRLAPSEAGPVEAPASEPPRVRPGLPKPPDQPLRQPLPAQPETATDNLADAPLVLDRSEANETRVTRPAAAIQTPEREPPTLLAQPPFQPVASPTPAPGVERVAEKAMPSAPVGVEAAREAATPAASQPQAARPAAQPVLPLTNVTPAANERPLVTVRIGRIEIRATRPPAPAVARKPAAQRKPVMSLERYLKQRSGEKP